MSGSPMYSVVAFDPVSLTVGLALSGGLAAARRARERERAEQRAALARERARQAALRRAEIERRNAALAARRGAEREAHAATTRSEQARADGRRLDEIDTLIARLRTEQGAGTALASVETRLAELRRRVSEGTPLGSAVEELRARVVTLHPADRGPAPRVDQQEVLAALDRRLSELPTDGARWDQQGAARCAELLDRLRAASGPGQEVGFEALLGTVEHELDRHTGAVVDAVDADRRERDAREERAAALHEALAEADGRWGVVEEAVRGAAQDAVELAAPELAERLEAAARTVTESLAARRADAALAAVADVERLLPQAEERLDELQLAYSRRGDLAQALKDAMTGAGLAFAGGEEQGERLTLSFTRPSGAMYEAQVGMDRAGELLLTYRVDGEADMSLRRADNGAVCTPEELLERVHRSMGEEGFRPGELTWEGKPPRSAARNLPGHEARRNP